MFLRKSAFIILVIFTFQYALAIDMEELNPEFFGNFNDPYLVQYINETYENNHSLKKANAVVEQYRHQVKYFFGQELPSLSMGTTYSILKTPIEYNNLPIKKDVFALPFVANYEADFLFKNRDKTRGAKKSFEAMKYIHKATYVSLLSDVAGLYANILQYDALIQKQESLLTVSEELLGLNQKMFDQGVITNTQLNMSKRARETAQSTLETLKKEQEVLLAQFAVLIGRSPNEAIELQRGKLQDFEYQGIVPDSIESDVIFSRPDMMAAEAKLEKAKIDIRIARKNFLPIFNITGMWAFNTATSGTFFSRGLSFGEVFARVMQTLFSGGRRKANLRIQKAKYEELFEDYQQIGLDAAKEVNNALCAIKHDACIENSAKVNMDYEAKNFEHAEKKYEQGSISRLEYLNSQAAALTQDMEFLKAKTQCLVSYISLYKAVGGSL